MQADNRPKHGIPFGFHMLRRRMLSAKEVANGRACECVCVACGARLKARQGAIRVWHFAHDGDMKCQHAPEAAIHRMAKQMITDRSAVFVPALQRSRTIHGKRRVWTERISVDVQIAGLQTLEDCTQEKTVGDANANGESRRPDVLGTLDGFPLAIEIRNTHAVDFEKQEWFEKHGYSVLEIAVADIAILPPEQIMNALETRLFKSADHSDWLVHAKDREALDALDQLEAQIRESCKVEEQELVAKLDTDETAQRRKEEARKRFKDIEDFRIRVGRCTIRIGRNEQRVSLKKYGSTPDTVFEGLKRLARKNHGRFNNRGGCWEFYRYPETESFFKLLCTELQRVCRELLCGAPRASMQSARDIPLPTPEIKRPLPVHFHDPALQEAFDERAAILEYDAELSRNEAENRALAYVTGSLVTRSHASKGLD